ncbi:hypothetical protein AAGF08_03505 [Algoriphagus sp. SE2]|uniref:hypothetical protein n=1 Tax=Algoriphagus sp. SE2 TaxID=3141536 RepID=UPI0031CCF0A6
MKEDKSDKWIASSLKKYLEEGQTPYEIGAWENFQKIRKARRRKVITYWIGAVAASLLLLFGISQVFLEQNDLLNGDSDVLVLGNSEKLDNPLNSLENIQEDRGSENKNIEVIEGGTPTNPSDELNSREPVPGTLEKETKSKNFAFSKEQNAVESISKENNSIAMESDSKSQEKEKSDNLSNEKSLAAINPEKEKVNTENSTNSSEQNVNKESFNSSLINPEESIGKTNLIADKEDVMTKEEDFPEIPKEHTKVYLGMGLTPGFGSFQENNTTTTASSFGVGMSLNVDLPGKLTLGSGFGVNYLNQQNESQMPITIAGYRTSQVETQDIQQVQLELPLYLRYPITRNNSISIQAGFSNLYAINRNAEQVTTVNEQVAVNNSSDNSSFALASNSISQTQVLTNDDSRFYPFATLNFGLNFRVLESKKVNYMIMPFYNHQLRTISGFGDNFGMFGASLKFNFGGVEK